MNFLVPDVRLIGTQRTMLVNFKEIADRARISQEHLMIQLAERLETTVDLFEDKFVIKGRFTRDDILNAFF